MLTWELDSSVPVYWRVTSSFPAVAGETVTALAVAAAAPPGFWGASLG